MLAQELVAMPVSVDDVAAVVGEVGLAATVVAAVGGVVAVKASLGANGYGRFFESG